MGLESHSRSILRSELSKEYLKRITYLTSDSRIDFRTDLEENLKNQYSDEKIFNYLVSEKSRIKEIIKNNDFPENIDEWLSYINDLMELRLTQMDLSLVEMSSQLNIDLFLSIIEKGNELIDDANLFLNKLNKVNEDEWSEIIDEIGSRSKSNMLFWDNFNKRFNYDALDRSDKSNLKLIYALGKDFYKNLNTKLLIVLNPYNDSKTGNKEKILIAFTTVINSFLRKENDILNNTIRIKEWYDENVEDISYKLLLMKIMEDNNEMKKNYSFELLMNYKVIEQRLLSCPKTETIIAIPINKNKKALIGTTKGLTWERDPGLIKILYQLLLEKNIIEPIQSDFNSFNSFFSDNVEIGERFKWKADSNLLAYLFEELAYNNYLSAMPRDFSYNSLIKNTGFFVKGDLTHINNLKSLKNLYSNSATGLPRNNKVIDEIISSLNQT